MNVAAQQVADRYQVRLAVREVCASKTFKRRTAALNDLTPEVLEAFGTAFYLPTHQNRVAFGGLVRKLKKLVDLFKKVPKVWDRIKDFLGIKGITDIPKKIKEWAKKGKQAIIRAFRELAHTFPFSLYFIPQNKMPNLTDLLNRVTGNAPWMAKALAGAKSFVKPLDDFVNSSRVLKGMRRPVVAAIFIWIWFNVAELSWDVEGLIQGFTGGMSFGELLSTLPESGIGLLAAMAGLGYGALPITFIGRIIYLAAKKFISWAKGNIVVYWQKMGVDKPDEVIPVFG